MSVMTNMNSTSNFLFGASEHELLTLSLSEIIDGLMNDYKSFSQGDGAGIRIPDSKQEPRMAHSSILFAEGVRLALTYPELGKKLVLASLFNNHERAAYWTVERLSRESEKDEVKCRRMSSVGDEAPNILTILRMLADHEGLSTEEIILLANYFGFNIRVVRWLDSYGELLLLEPLIKKIEEFEAFKAAERKRKKKELEEEIKRLKGQTI